jgi:hypothetical protein
MPDAAEAAASRDDFRFQHRARGVAQQQAGVADDAGADRGGTVAAARAFSIFCESEGFTKSRE